MSTERGGAIKASIRAILEVANAEGKLQGFPLRVGEWDGMWDAVKGGGYTSSVTKMNPFAGEERVYPGLPETEDLTLEAAFMLEDHQAIMATLGGAEDPRGRRCQVQVHVRDSDGHYQINRPPVPGIIQSLTGPEGDSNDATVANIQVVIKAGTQPEAPGGQKQSTGQEQSPGQVPSGDVSTHGLPYVGKQTRQPGSR